MTVGTGISIASGLASAGVALHDYLSNKGYVTLEPGETWTSDKMAKSLWRQCECIRSRKEGNYMVVERLMMRPIFSGLIPGSTMEHPIGNWGNDHDEVSRHLFKSK